MDLPLCDNYLSIVLERRPLIDVRAPMEFAKGAFPGAVNLPLMSDRERHLVGITYKEEGNEAAVALGHELVSGEVKEDRVRMWCDFLKKHSEALLYCFRGGQRSQIAQRWIYEAGCEVVRIEGGYKAFRRFLIDESDRSVERFEPIVLGGRTGSGKTLLLHTLDNSVDLEHLANHRGSSFGRKISPQPTQIAFENALAYELIEKSLGHYRHLIFEDEGKNVGRLYLPDRLSGSLAEAPLVILETPLEERVEITFEEYVLQAQNLYAEAGFDNPMEKWFEDMLLAVDRIRRRLGGERHMRVRQMIAKAYGTQQKSGETESHKIWIAYLLKEYYDPMYDYQIEKRFDRIMFRGNEEAVKAFLADRR